MNFNSENFKADFIKGLDEKIQDIETEYNLALVSKLKNNNYEIESQMQSRINQLEEQLRTRDPDKKLKKVLKTVEPTLEGLVQHEKRLRGTLADIRAVVGAKFK
jgi:archaellum component FlaC